MRIFISYAREDADQADRLFGDLSKIEELSPWLDREHLLPGARWKDEILTAMEESRFVALILSTRSVSKTGFVQKEFRAAIDRLSYHPPGSTFLIPVRIEPCSPRHPELKDLQYVDMFPDWEEGIVRLRRAITAQIDEDLSSIFERLSDCHHFHFPKEKEWLETYGDKVLGYSAPSLLRALDSANQRYADELYCLQVMAELAKRQKDAKLLDFAIRIHDITKLCQHEHEMPSFYGTLLYVSSLLDSSARSLFLRAVVHFWIEHTAGYNHGSWWSDLVFRDLLKNFVAAETSTYVSGQTMSRVPHFSKADVGPLILKECLPLITWDIPRADFLTFWARRTGRLSLLLDVANGLLSSFGHGDFGSSLERSWRPNIAVREGARRDVESPDRLFSKVGGYRNEMKNADYREDFHRFGILLRIAEYLRYEKNSPGVMEYSKRLNAACLDVLSRRESEREGLLSALSDQERTRLFWVIERQASQELQKLLPAATVEDCEFFLDLVPWSCKYRSKEQDNHLPITLAERALPLELPETSTDVGA